ncbi:alpha/beta fold hydrolase [Streptomyces sp. NPDC050658]|uniref:alpha/beta fold hydrolase n=1 Tax=unclassified Streptomyces TaxID=2593676 RepID=UPI00344472D0
MQDSSHSNPKEQYVDVAPGVRLWTERRGAPDAPPLVLIMGALASGLGWPEPLVEALAAHHQVIRYDHRDTGRSTADFDGHPYSVADMGRDVVAVLDGLGIERAHLVGMSLGGMLSQLVMSDHPERVLSVTMFGTSALSTTPYRAPDGTEVPVAELPGVSPVVMDLWSTPVQDKGPEAELDRRVEHWRALNGRRLPFDPEYFRALERRIIAHAGTHVASTAHARADDSGLLRTEELARTQIPALIISATGEPVFPPPHAQHLAQVIAGARLTEIEGMGHALPASVLTPLAEAILAQTRASAAQGQR